MQFVYVAIYANTIERGNYTMTELRTEWIRDETVSTFSRSSVSGRVRVTRVGDEKKEKRDETSAAILAGEKSGRTPENVEIFRFSRITLGEERALIGGENGQYGRRMEENSGVFGRRRLRTRWSLRKREVGDTALSAKSARLLRRIGSVCKLVVPLGMPGVLSEVCYGVQVYVFEASRNGCAFE